MSKYSSASRRTASLHPLMSKAIRVLVLEDDADLKEVLATLLDMEGGFEMDACSDVCDCLRLLRAASQPDGHPPYDVLLLDLRLSGGSSGAEVLEAADVDPQLELPPVVVCTALAQHYVDTYEALFAAHHARVLPKPFDNDDLLAALRDAATRRD